MNTVTIDARLRVEMLGGFARKRGLSLRFMSRIEPTKSRLREVCICNKIG
jgi:hypothetical protein